MLKSRIALAAVLACLPLASFAAQVPFDPQAAGGTLVFTFRAPASVTNVTLTSQYGVKNAAGRIDVMTTNCPGTRSGNVWTFAIPAEARGTYNYSFRADGRTILDPYNPNQHALSENGVIKDLSFYSLDSAGKVLYGRYRDFRVLDTNGIVLYVSPDVAQTNVERSIDVLSRFRKVFEDRMDYDIESSPFRICAYLFASFDEEHSICGIGTGGHMIFGRVYEIAPVFSFHEYVHAIHEQMVPASRKSVFLEEGLAGAFDCTDVDNGRFPLRNYHDTARAIYDAGHAITPASLLNNSYWFDLSDTGGFYDLYTYTLAGSFVKYLYETYGAAKLKKLIAANPLFPEDWDKAMLSIYGIKFAAMEANWKALVMRTPPQAVPDAVRSRMTDGFERLAAGPLPPEEPYKTFAQLLKDGAKTVFIIDSRCGNYAVGLQSPDGKITEALLSECGPGFSLNGLCGFRAQ